MTTIAAARAKAETGERLSLADAMTLYQENDLLFLAACARRMKEKKSGRKVFYTVNRHINLTNICRSHCPLCAFQVGQDDPRGFVLEAEDIDRITAEARTVKICRRCILSPRCIRTSRFRIISMWCAA